TPPSGGLVVSVIAIVQARMGSTRLPGKVLRDVLGRPLLQWLLERLRLAKRIQGIVVATTTAPGDDPIETLCDKLGVSCYRGSEFDVLDRYHDAAVAAHAERIVRVTADCPLLDPSIVDQLVDLLDRTECDYASTDERTFPLGMDAEAFTFTALEAAW